MTVFLWLEVFEGWRPVGGQLGAPKDYQLVHIRILLLQYWYMKFLGTGYPFLALYLNLSTAFFLLLMNLMRTFFLWDCFALLFGLGMEHSLTREQRMTDEREGSFLWVTHEREREREERVQSWVKRSLKRKEKNKQGLKHLMMARNLGSSSLQTKKKIWSIQFPIS